MKKRILFVIDGMEFGGGERGFAQIINGLPEREYESFLASGPQGTFYDAISHAPVKRHPVDFSNRFNFSVLIDLIRIIRNSHIDIVHGQGARAEFYARLASGLAGKTKYVSTVQMPVEGYDVGHWKSLFYRIFDRFSERFVDRFLVVSSVLAQAMIQGHGIPPARVVKIYNGIETDYYKPLDLEEGRRSVRKEYCVTDSEILIGSLGRLVWQKGFQYFIDAVPLLVRGIPHAKFCIVGEGPLRQALEGQSRSLGLQDRLVFMGHRNDIREIMVAMDIVVIPSLLEGFPMITLEAMAMGKPLVATTIDGILEQITDGKEGLLIVPKSPPAIAQAVKRLADDPDYARSLGVNAREKVVREFSVRKMITETMEVYETL